MARQGGDVGPVGLMGRAFTLAPMRTGRFLLPLCGLLLAACTSSSPPFPAVEAPPVTAAGSEAPAAKVIKVLKPPTCSCCHEWEAYLRGLGWVVESVPTDDMMAVKAAYGLPRDAWSCHTAVVAGYGVEGHVPVEGIEDLLRERPAIDAIALPAMPPGSPGMPGVKEAAFEIIAIDDGRTTSFGQY